MIFNKKPMCLKLFLLDPDQWDFNKFSMHHLVVVHGPSGSTFLLCTMPSGQQIQWCNLLISMVRFSPCAPPGGGACLSCPCRGWSASTSSTGVVVDHVEFDRLHGSRRGVCPDISSSRCTGNVIDSTRVVLESVQACQSHVARGI